MTALVEGAKRLVGRGNDVTDRIDGLEEAARSARGRLPDGTVSSTRPPRSLIAPARGCGSPPTTPWWRSRGPPAPASRPRSTPSRVSTWPRFAGVRRPTTSWTMACTWGDQGAEELLDWLGVPQRHQVRRDSMLDEPRDPADSRLDGLVLLDLPDHDSVVPSTAPSRGAAVRARRPARVGGRPAEVRRRRPARALPARARRPRERRRRGAQPRRDVAESRRAAMVDDLRRPARRRRARRRARPGDLSASTARGWPSCGRRWRDGRPREGASATRARHGRRAAVARRMVEACTATPTPATRPAAAAAELVRRRRRGRRSPTVVDAVRRRPSGRAARPPGGP